MTDDELNQWIQDLLEVETDTDSEQDRYRYDRERLLQVVDENNGLRDDCFYTPETILVYTEEAESLEAVPIWELPLRFPLTGRGARWGHASFGEIIEQKATLYRQSKAANDIAETVPGSTPECGTVCLIVPKREGVMSWTVIKARVAPELNR